MNIMTIGASPYLITASGQLNASILEHLYTEDIPIASIVWGHDITYHIPETDDKGKQHYYYEFDYQSNKHKIPVVPIRTEGVEYTAKVIYEMLKLFGPDMVITIGDFNDSLYMQAVKELFPEKIKWLAILANHSHPINEHNQELPRYMDGVLCTNHFSYEMIRALSPLDIVSAEYVGVDRSKFFFKGSKSGCRVMTCGKNTQSDNVPVLMEAVSQLKMNSCHNMSLYVHSNVLDQGDYDMSLLQSRFDPDREFIEFPEKYVSLSDGYSVEDYRKELAISTIFASTSMASATCMSIFEAIACGCVPIMTDTPCSREIAEELAGYLSGFNAEDFLFPAVPMMTTGETYLYICDRGGVREKLHSMHRKLSKKKGQIEGYMEELFQFIINKDRKKFLKEVLSMALKVKDASEAICLDAVV